MKSSRLLPLLLALTPLPSLAAGASSPPERIQVKDFKARLRSSDDSLIVICSEDDGACARSRRSLEFVQSRHPNLSTFWITYRVEGPQYMLDYFHYDHGRFKVNFDGLVVFVHQGKVHRLGEGSILVQSDVLEFVNGILGVQTEPDFSKIGFEELHAQNAAEKLQSRGHYVLVETTAPNCGWCQKLKPEFKYVKHAYGGRMEIYLVDYYRSASVIAQYDLAHAQPGFTLYFDGKKIASRIGYASHEAVLESLNEFAPHSP